MQLATCGDDNLVRMWRPNSEVAHAARRDINAPERWHYSGAWAPKNVKSRMLRSSPGPQTASARMATDAMDCD